MSQLVTIITSKDPAIRNRSLDSVCRLATTALLMEEVAALDKLWRAESNLYERVRAQFFLYAIHRFYLPFRPELGHPGPIPFQAAAHLLGRRFEEAIQVLLRAQNKDGLNAALSSAFASAYRGLAFKTLADQVRQSVRTVRGNQWMSRIGYPGDCPLQVRPELLERSQDDGSFPILQEATPVRMDLTHSAWSDIFFLGMDYPEGARVLNVSIDLSVRGGASGTPSPPVEAYFRVIEEPVFRLTSVDLGATTDVTSFAEMFDFARDYLGLLKAAVIASGLVPPAMEGAVQPLSVLLRRLTGDGRGIELVSHVKDIPKGSRLAVSTNLLAGLIAACMRATDQIKRLTGPLTEGDRRLVAARAILGEWIGGSGGGWQDSGGVWPGMKTIEGVEAGEGDPEFGISRGRLLPVHHVLSKAEVSDQTRQKLQESLVLVHGGMAQDVGPILEMVTEKYLLRSEAEWAARQDAIAILDEILADLRRGDVKAVGKATERNFAGPIQAVIPWATNAYTETLINRARAEMGSEFWGFWMLGGMAGGGMGFIFSPEHKERAQERMRHIMLQTKRSLEQAVPFAMDPVVYDFSINEHGTVASLHTGPSALMPAAYYGFVVPALLRMEPRLVPASRRIELDRFGAACRVTPELAGMVQGLFDRLLPSSSEEKNGTDRSLRDLLTQYGFDPVAHEQIRSDLRNGRIGIAQNRLAVTARIENVLRTDVFDVQAEAEERHRIAGTQALAEGKVAVVALAGGAGSRWTKGAGVVKALTPFCKFHGRHRSFIDVHIAKARKSSNEAREEVPMIVTTSYLTHTPIAAALSNETSVILSPGQSIGLRLIPMVRDLRFAWEEMPQQTLDEQKQKVRESLHAALMQWAQKAGEGNDYTDNLPAQCLHPTGHWFEISNLLRNGVLKNLLDERPQLRYLMMHNIDTLGANVDPKLLGYHIEQNAGLTFEVISRFVDDRGGGLARVDGRLRLVEGLALPSEEVESSLSYYNSNTCWIDVDQLLAAFSLERSELGDAGRVTHAVRELASRMPTYLTLKDVKKRWGKGQEDIFPVVQFEKLFVDMSDLPGLPCRYALVPRQRGQQLKEPAQLDGWLRDGSAAYVDSLCDWA